jgi:hypothetical protein
MPPLENPRWERFAQELAKGKRAHEAYVLAGYKENAGNATRLKLNEKIIARVQGLLGRSAARAEVTVASILSELEEARKLAAEINQPSAAVAATLGKAKVAGLIVDRKEVGHEHKIVALSPEEVRMKLIESRKRLLEAGVDLDLLPVVEALPERVGQEDH